jgi:hypothetical protein
LPTRDAVHDDHERGGVGVGEHALQRGQLRPPADDGAGPLVDHLLQGARHAPASIAARRAPRKPLRGRDHSAPARHRGRAPSTA